MRTLLALLLVSIGVAAAAGACGTVDYPTPPNDAPNTLQPARPDHRTPLPPQPGPQPDANTSGPSDAAVGPGGS